MNTWGEQGGNRAVGWFCSRASGCYRVCCLLWYRRAPVLLYWQYVGWQAVIILHVDRRRKGKSVVLSSLICTLCPLAQPSSHQYETLCNRTCAAAVGNIVVHSWKQQDKKTQNIYRDCYDLLCISYFFFSLRILPVLSVTLCRRFWH